MKQHKALMVAHLEAKMQPLHKHTRPPVGGWIKAVRTTLGISLKQLALRLSATPQSIWETEKRERQGSVTLQRLRETARGLDMILVYGLVPKEGSMDALIEKRARDLATTIVLRASQTMALEDQENGSERLQEAIKERTQILKDEMPKMLWD